MPRPALEVADIFRVHGSAWRQANAGHVSLDQLKVMSAIESCRTAALGGHVARCEKCSHTLIAEFIRRFLIHVLPSGFHRIRHYGLLAGSKRADNIARARQLLAVTILPIDAINAASTDADEPQTPEHPCPCCGGRMIIIETFRRGCSPRHHPATPVTAIRIDSS